MKGDVCRVDECSNICTRGLICNTHASRKARTGTFDKLLHKTKPVQYYKSAIRGEWSYHSVHNRIKRTLGPASEQCCVECGSIAREWAFMSGSPFSLLGTNQRGEPRWFSPRMADYQPMCKPCHERMDRSK